MIAVVVAAVVVVVVVIIAVLFAGAGGHGHGGDVCEHFQHQGSNTSAALATPLRVAIVHKNQQNDNNNQQK